MLHRVKSIRPLLVVFVLGLLGTAGDAQAQGGTSIAVSTDASSQSAPVLPLSSASSSTQSASSLNPYRSLEKYVQQREARLLARPPLDNPTRRGVSLDRGGKLLWGTVGLVMSSFCDSDSDTYTDHPSPLRSSYEQTCVECDRMGKRSLEAITEGLLSSDP